MWRPTPIPALSKEIKNTKGAKLWDYVSYISILHRDHM